ncbi:hypothetical protein STEG23_023664, partial [Scotinomys teguina]
MACSGTSSPVGTGSPDPEQIDSCYFQIILRRVGSRRASVSMHFGLDLQEKEAEPELIWLFKRFILLCTSVYMCAHIYLEVLLPQMYTWRQGTLGKMDAVYLQSTRLHVAPASAKQGGDSAQLYQFFMGLVFRAHSLIKLYCDLCCGHRLADFIRIANRQAALATPTRQEQQTVFRVTLDPVFQEALK